VILLGLLSHCQLNTLCAVDTTADPNIAKRLTRSVGRCLATPTNQAKFYRATLCASAVFAVVRCPSVRPSDTLVDCIHTAEDIVKLIARPAAPSFSAPVPNSKGNPFGGGAKYTGVAKFAISSKIAVYLGNGTS